jgi:hypothetical protein
MALSKLRSDSFIDNAITGQRNLIINGAMQVAQRATGATAIGTGYYTLDRFKTHKNNDGAFTTEQSTDHPNGAGNSLKWAVTTADSSVAAGQYLYMSQHIEAQNLQHLLYGTSSAKSITLSFWVKSNKTGTYSIVIRKLDSTQYNFVHEYTISSADTWEKKEITISPTAGSTSFITASGGAIANDNGSGLQIGWNLAWGSTYNGATNNAWSSDTNDYATSNQVNWMDSTSNNFYLTEVQLEVGEQATPFEHRSYGDELARCRRYYEQWDGTDGRYLAAGYYNSTTQSLYAVQMRAEKRAAPTVSFAGTASHFLITRPGTSTASAGTKTVDDIGVSMFKLNSTNNPSTHTAGQGSFLGVYSTSIIKADAEL